MPVKPIGKFPSPYGLLIDIYPGQDRHDPNGYVFNADGMAILFGIYDPAQRKRFAEICTRGGGISSEHLRDVGGHMIPKIPLPRPHEPATPELPGGIEIGIPTDAWIDRLLETKTWFDRSKWLEKTIADNLNASKNWKIPPEFVAFGLQTILTAALEHLPDKEIACLEAAAWFAVSAHDEWRDAGLHWLEPFQATWLRDWLSARPRYRRFARLRRKLDPALPSWIAEVAS